MKECPNCKELIGDDVKLCFNCNYNFALRRVMTSAEKLQKKNIERKRQGYLFTNIKRRKRKSHSTN